MNRLQKLFSTNPSNVLSIYYTAGFPQLNDTLKIAKELEDSGVQVLEIGIPFSDPLADGPVIQESSTVAIENGMNIETLFKQLENLRSTVSLPVVLMGYLNPILQYGFESFLIKCKACDIDGVIIPDLPLDEIEHHYGKLLDKYNIYNISLVTPHTPPNRIYTIDKLSKGFVYFVSSSSITGNTLDKNDLQQEYFKKIKSLKIKNSKLIGFGISNNETFKTACEYANGAIIGSAFIKALKNKQNIKEFINHILHN
jgi:tryptophan synthase alpha chain